MAAPLACTSVSVLRARNARSGPIRDQAVGTCGPCHHRSRCSVQAASQLVSCYTQALSCGKATKNLTEVPQAHPPFSLRKRQGWWPWSGLMTRRGCVAFGILEAGVRSWGQGLAKRLQNSKSTSGSMQWQPLGADRSLCADLP